MQVETLLKVLNADFYTGVPDSQLKALCSCLIERYGTDPRRHIIAANEGNAAAIAAGYHLATGKIPVVYMQNSGEGNLVNPAASLLHKKVYGIPMIFVIGWRGEPGVHDEPQHVWQGEITRSLLNELEIPSFVIGTDTTEAALCAAMEEFRPLLDEGRDVAFVGRCCARRSSATLRRSAGTTPSSPRRVRPRGSCLSCGPPPGSTTEGIF